METKTHRVPCEVTLDTWTSGQLQYVAKTDSLPYGLATSYKSHKDALKNLDNKIMMCAREGAIAAVHCQQICMVCNDGSTLIGQWRYSNWCYSIGHSDTKSLAGSVCCGSVKTFEELETAMRKHALQCYAGVKHSFRF